MIHPKIKLIGDPILRKKAEKVDIIDQPLLDLIEEMKVVMDEAKGVGLAANQIGSSKSVFVLNVRGSVETFLNPEIVAKSELQDFKDEGCLSIPGTSSFTKRYNKITLRYIKPTNIGEIVEEELVGLPAVAVQHEVDHLEGKLFVDQFGQLKKTMVLDKHRKYMRLAKDGSNNA